MLCAKYGGKMKYEIGQLIVGKVTKVKPFALFLEFEDGSNGLLHISEISNSFIKDIERFGTVGDLLKVMVVAIDETNGFLRVSYKRVPEEETYSTHNNNVRNALTTEGSDFEVLKKRLPKWIKETLKEAEQEDEEND